MIPTTETIGDKRSRMAALGYAPAGKPTRCCLCTGKIAPGQYVGKMPASWDPSNPRRHAHHRCIDKLREHLRAKAAGEAIAPLTWTPPKAAWAPRTPRQEPLSAKARYRAERASEVRQVAAPIIERDGQRAAEYVARYVRETGAGPIWREVGDALGWPAKPWGIRAYIVRGLAQAGWLAYTDDEHRSLRPGPAWQQSGSAP